MEDETPLKKSFSAWKRLGFNLDLLVRTGLVLAVVIMVNYLGVRWYHRFALNARTSHPLSERTLGLLKSITNEVNVLVYYDRDEDLFSSITGLLDEYHEACPRIHVSLVDYIRNAGAAERFKADERYKSFLTGTTNKNLVLFECNGAVKAVNGQAIGQYVYERVPNPTQPEFRKHLMFYGESLFTGALLTVLTPKPFKAYYLTDHSEHRPDSLDDVGYAKFVSVLQQNRVQVETLSLLGTNLVPADCNLLVIAGPREPLRETECDRVDDYLRQGGRLLALVNSGSTARWTGLERILNGWGVAVGRDRIIDPQNTSRADQSDVIATDFSPHTIVNPLIGSQLQFWLPRPVEPLVITNPPANAPVVSPLAWSSPAAKSGNLGPRRFCLAVAVEKGNVRGVVTERGTTRIVAAGDSVFLSNYSIGWPPNRDFLDYSINWLLERSQLMQGLGPRPVAEFRLNLTHAQQVSAQWLLLAVIPGAVLLFGGLVWLRRRK